jgi:hypothetical protein
MGVAAKKSPVAVQTRSWASAAREIQRWIA